jgi:hypothetical protein
MFVRLLFVVNMQAQNELTPKSSKRARQKYYRVLLKMGSGEGTKSVV